MATKKAFSLSLPPALRTEAENLAKKKRRSVQAVLCTALERYLNEIAGGKDRNGTPAKPVRRKRAPKHRAGSLADFFDAVQKDLRAVPKREWEKLPRDGALHHDRYIYGRS